MRSRENLLRLKHFQVEDKTRQLAQIDIMIAEMNKMSDDLSAQIRYEEDKSGMSDPSHFAYPTFAKAARQRRDNLAVSIRDISAKREAAVDALLEAEEELKKAQLLDSRDGSADPQISESDVERRVMLG
jgi:flagellar export protein FliJ